MTPIQALQRTHHRKFRRPGHLSKSAIKPQISQWLWGSFSLTKRLAKLSTHSIQIQHFHTITRYPSLKEQQLLGLARSEWIYERSIQLGHHKSQHIPSISATTIFPVKTLNGCGRQFRRLGRKSLGSILFKKQGYLKTLRWVEINHSKNEGSHSPIRTTTLKQNLPYIRCSLYHWHKLPLIVKEQFNL